MESSIAGLLILSVLIVAVVLLSRAYVASTTMLGVAMVESVNLANEKSKTDLSIEYFSTSSTSTNNTLIVKVRNSGSTPIADYDDMDVFVDDERLTYATSTVASTLEEGPMDRPWGQDLEPNRDHRHRGSHPN